MFVCGSTYAIYRLYISMAIHVQDEEADWMIREFARRRGVGITAAIKLAVQEATANERSSAEDLLRKIEPLVREVRAKMKPQAQSDKEFMDDMWGEND